MEIPRMNSDAPATRPKTKGFYLPLKPNDDIGGMDSDDDDDNEVILDTNENFTLNRIPNGNHNGSALTKDFNEINIMTNPAVTETETRTETFDSQVHLHVDSDYDEEEDECAIGTNRGPHIIVFSLICSPAIFVISILVTGYVGLLSFLNILCHFFDERTLIYRVCVCPIIMIISPPLVVVFTLMLAVFSALEQVSWFYDSWWESVSNLEKGFYSWLCEQFGLQNCCPYESIKIADDDYESVSQDFDSIPVGSTDV